MAGVNLAGMTREDRRKTIVEQWLEQRSFVPCCKLPEAEEAVHMLKQQDIRRLSDVNGSPALEEQLTGKFKEIVEALVWFNRDVTLLGGRPLSLLDRILCKYDAAAESIWMNVNRIVEHLRGSTVFVHIGDGTVARVLGAPVKMYISEKNEFYDAAVPGYFLEQYYIRENGDNDAEFTLNIVKQEVPYHFECNHVETVIAYMLTRHMGTRCREVLQAVQICEEVASLVSGEARIVGSLVTTGIQAEFNGSDIIARMLLTLGVKEDLSSKVEGESSAYQRLSVLNSGILLSNLEWLSRASICDLTGQASDIDYRITDPIIDVGGLSVRDLPLSHSCHEYVFSDKKVFRRNIKRTICSAALLVGLISLASWATLSQEVSAAERVQKWLTLALFGCIAIAFTLVGSDRRRDLLRELCFFRKEMFSSAGMRSQELPDFTMAIGMEVKKRRGCISKKNASWLGTEIDGTFEFHRALQTGEIAGSRLLLRKNGDLTFSWGAFAPREPERFASLGTDGILEVGREAGPIAGIIIRCDDVRIA